MTAISIQELVRRDLLHREQENLRLYGSAVTAYSGRSAILDAYEEALDLCVYLRQVIEEMTIGDRPPTKVRLDRLPVSETLRLPNEELR